MTLWPKVEKGNWLVFDSQGGSYIEPAFYAPGQMTAAPAAPAKLGYEFAGWYTDASLTEEYVFGGELTAGTTVYAKWTPSTAGYTILYWTENADDENYSYVGSRDVTGATVGETIVLTSSQTSTNNLDSSYRQYFTYERSDEGRQVSGDGSTIVNVYYARKTYTLTFRERTSGGWWGSGSYETVATITAKYDAYIAEEFEKAPFSTTYAGRAWEATSYYSYALQTLDRMPGANVTFDLYNKSSNTLKTIYYYVQTVESGESTPSWPSRPTSDFELLKTVTTYFNYATYEEEYHEIQGFTRYSASAAGFRNNQKNFTNNTLYLYYIRNTYELSYYNVDGVVRTVDVKYQAPLAEYYEYVPERPASIPESYVFGGWYTSPACEDGTEAAVTLATMPVDGAVVYAKWTAPVFNGTAYLTMGGLGGSYDFQVTYGDTIDESKLPSWEAVYTAAGLTAEEAANYQWRGWCVRSGTEGSYVYTPFNFDTEIYGDVTLYPYYTSAEAYTVQYDAGAGTNAPVDGKTYAQGSYAGCTAGADGAGRAGISVLDGRGAGVLPWRQVRDHGERNADGGIRAEAGDGDGDVLCQRGRRRELHDRRAGKQRIARAGDAGDGGDQPGRVQLHRLGDGAGRRDGVPAGAGSDGRGEPLHGVLCPVAGADGHGIHGRDLPAGGRRELSGAGERTVYAGRDDGQRSKRNGRG